MMKFFKKEAEDTADINSWVFEQDIKQIFMKGCGKKSKTILDRLILLESLCELNDHVLTKCSCSFMLHGRLL